MRIAVCRHAAKIPKCDTATRHVLRHLSSMTGIPDRSRGLPPAADGFCRYGWNQHIRCHQFQQLGDRHPLSPSFPSLQFHPEGRAESPGARLSGIQRGRKSTPVVRSMNEVFWRRRPPCVRAWPDEQNARVEFTPKSTLTSFRVEAECSAFCSIRVSVPPDGEALTKELTAVDANTQHFIKPRQGCW